MDPNRKSNNRIKLDRKILKYKWNIQTFQMRSIDQFCWRNPSQVIWLQKKAELVLVRDVTGWLTECKFPMKNNQQPRSVSPTDCGSLLGENYDSLPLTSLLSAEGSPEQPVVREREREFTSSFLSLFLTINFVFSDKITWDRILWWNKLKVFLLDKSGESTSTVKEHWFFPWDLDNENENWFWMRYYLE